MKTVAVVLAVVLFGVTAAAAYPALTMTRTHFATDLFTGKPEPATCERITVSGLQVVSVRPAPDRTIDTVLSFDVVARNNSGLALPRVSAVFNVYDARGKYIAQEFGHVTQRDGSPFEPVADKPDHIFQPGETIYLHVDIIHVFGPTPATIQPYDIGSIIWQGCNPN